MPNNIRDEIIDRLREAFESVRDNTPAVSGKPVQLVSVMERFTLPTDLGDADLPAVSFGYGGSRLVDGAFTQEEENIFSVYVYPITTVIRFGVWNALVTYGAGDRVTGSDNRVYTSKTNNNTGNNPVTDTMETNWEYYAERIDGGRGGGIGDDLMLSASAMEETVRRIVHDLNAYQIAYDDDTVEGVSVGQVLAGEGKFTEYEFMEFRLDFRVAYQIPLETEI